MRLIFQIINAEGAKEVLFEIDPPNAPCPPIGARFKGKYRVIDLNFCYYIGEIEVLVEEIKNF